MIAVFAAMNAEVRACLAALDDARQTTVNGISVVQGANTFVCQTGVGRRAKDTAETFLSQVSPTAILSVGTAGGLAPNVHVGHVIFCERVAHASETGIVSGDGRLLAAAQESARGLGISTRNGSAVTVDNVAWTPRDKARLHGNGAPDVVEMESFWIGRAAAARSLPFLAIRVVSDGRDDSLVEIPNLFDDLGNVNAAGVLAFTREHPEAIPELARQHERGGRALESLERFLCGFLPSLPGIVAAGERHT
jgi:nucleoside phosphorylase